MTERQERFCREYAKTGNGAEAYRLAGYKAKTNHAAAAGADRLLTKDDIKARVREIADLIKAEDIADIKEIQRFFTDVIRGEKPDRKVNEGGHVYDVINQANQIRCAELLAKMQGGFITTVDVKSDVPMVVIVDDLGG